MGDLIVMAARGVSSIHVVAWYVPSHHKYKIVHGLEPLRMAIGLRMVERQMLVDGCQVAAVNLRGDTPRTRIDHAIYKSG